jgi:glutathione S-transferase
MAFVLHVDSRFTSPWAMSVFVALSEKNLPFTVATVDLEAGQQHGGAFSGHAVTARVPALSEGGFTLTESTAITEYLDESYPPPEYTALYPSARRERAQARQLQAWLRSDLLPVRTERDTETVFLGKASAPLTPAGHAAAAKLVRVADQMVRGPNLFDDWSIADVDLTVMLMRLIVSGDPVSQKLRDYATLHWQRPSLQQWRAHHLPA